MSSDLYKRHGYLNKNIKFMFSSQIIEYDIASAGYSIVTEYNLLSKKDLKMLDSKTKTERKIILGLMQKNDKRLVKQMNECFVDARYRFFKANNIQDEEILSIKKDAIFCLRPCTYTKFNNIEFKEKNIYSSYMYINNYELYYNFNKLDIKGISDELLEYHNEYLISYIKTCFRNFEISSKETQLRVMKRFIDKYKRRELDVGYYREFNMFSKFREMNNDDYLFNQYWEDKVFDLDISYNYINIVIPILNIAI